MCFEERAFLSPNVCRQERAKLFQEFGGGFRSQLRDEGLDRTVIGQQLIDEGHGPAGRKEHLLLDFEVVDQFQFVAVNHAPRQPGEVLR